jgi:hypothetical protein
MQLRCNHWYTCVLQFLYTMTTNERNAVTAAANELDLQPLKFTTQRS